MGKKHQAGRPSVVVPNMDERRDFSDSESERVLRAAALAIARELGRQAADDIFNEVYNLLKDGK